MHLRLLPRRLAAIVYDSLLLSGVLFVATGLALALAVLVLGSEAVRTHNPLTGNPFLSTYLFLVCFFFYGGFWTHGGQTLGMRAWRLRVQQRNGHDITWWQALLRFLVAGLWLLPLVYLLVYLHQVFRIEIAPSVTFGLLSLLLLLVLNLPDRASETELVLLPRAARPPR